MAEPLLASLGVLLVVLTLLDAFVSIFSTRGAGPLTDFWLTRAHNAVLAIHERHAVHRPLAYVGPVLTVCSIAAWYGMLLLGWSLVFFAAPGAAQDSTTGVSLRSFAENVYFVGTTVSGVGYGDNVPSGFPWTTLSGLAAFSTTVIITSSLSYVLSVVQAALARKSLAQAVFKLGDSPQGVCARAMGEQWLTSHLTRVAEMIDDHAIRHLAYPVLHQFHSPDPKREPARAILLLSDALVLSRASGDVSNPGLADLLEQSIENYLQLVGARRSGEPSTGGDFLQQSAATIFGTRSPAPDAEAALRASLDRREGLRYLCRRAGWGDYAGGEVSAPRA